MIVKVDDPELITLIEKETPIERLERRMRPMSDWDRWWNEDSFNVKEVERHDGWWDFSGVGFLGKDERLLELVVSDWEVVESYNTNHSTIALALRNLIIGEHELSPDYIYLGDEKYQQFWEAVGSVGNWALNQKLQDPDVVASHDLIDASSYLKNGVWRLDNGGEQSCPWNCYSANTPWSMWDEYVEAWKSDDSVSKRQPFIDYTRKSLASILRIDIFGSDEKVDQFVVERIEADENPDILYQDWNIIEYKEKIEQLITSLKRFTQSVNDDPFNPEEIIQVESHGDLYYNLYPGTIGIILRKDLFKDGKLEKLMSGYQSDKGSYGMYTLARNVVESFDQLNEEVSRTMQEYLNREGVIHVPVPVLLPHLIGTHYLFEGKETIHRADPAFLIQALNLEGIKN